MPQYKPTPQHRNFSPAAFALSDTYQLGALQKEFRVRSGKKDIVSSLLFLLLSLGLGAIAFTFMSNGRSYNLLFCALATGFAVVALAIMISILLKPIRYRARRIYLHADGFLFVDGQDIQPFRWDAIEAMWQRLPEHNDILGSASHVYRVRRKDGSTVILNDLFPHIETLGERIRQEVTNCLLPLAIMSYTAGQTVAFGPLRVSDQGISNGRELLTWQQVQDIRLERNMIMVKKEDKVRRWPSIQVANVPNVFVFLALVHYILQHTGH